MADGNRKRIMKEFNLQPREFPEAMKLCSEQWNKLPTEEKAAYQEKSKTEMAKWKLDMEKYKETTSYREFKKLKSEQKFKKIGKMKNPKDPNAPKRPLSGYFLFMKEFRLTRPNLAMKDVSTLGGKAWKELNEDGRKRFVDAANEERVVYTKALEEYVKTDSYSTFQEKLKAFKVKKKQQMSAMLKTKNKKKKV